LFVLNRIADEQIESFLRQRLAAGGIEPIGVIHQDPGIGKAWLTGVVLNDSKVHSDVAAIVQRVIVWV
jgi:CO dehydrogenase nickel-insertion accessory protein CooC1